MAIENRPVIENRVADISSSLVPPPASEHQSVTCTAITTDAISGPLGISAKTGWIFRVNDGAITDFRWELDEQPRSDLETRFERYASIATMRA